VANWLDANALSLQAKRLMHLEKAYQSPSAEKEQVNTIV
jgi:putative oxidoreductase